MIELEKGKVTTWKLKDWMLIISEPPLRHTISYGALGQLT